MRFDVLTLFPEMFRAVTDNSIIQKAVEKGLIQVQTVNIREYSKNKHKKVDEYPYGGGTGMVMTPQPIFDAYSAVLGESLSKGEGAKPHCVYLSPQGQVLTQAKLGELKEKGHLILLCGHYEGVDERILEEIVDEEISVGDYVLTGGELPAMILIDGVSRLVPGVLGGENGFAEESHMDGLLEYPQYTRPPEFMGRIVPDILLNGHHAHINQWRKIQSFLRTSKRRPDLFHAHLFSMHELSLLVQNEGLNDEIRGLVLKLEENEAYAGKIQVIRKKLREKERRKSRRRIRKKDDKGQ